MVTQESGADCRGRERHGNAGILQPSDRKGCFEATLERIESTEKITMKL